MIRSVPTPRAVSQSPCDPLSTCSSSSFLSLVLDILIRARGGRTKREDGRMSLAKSPAPGRAFANRSRLYSSSRFPSFCPTFVLRELVYASGGSQALSLLSRNARPFRVATRVSRGKRGEARGKNEARCIERLSHSSAGATGRRLFVDVVLPRGGRNHGVGGITLRRLPTIYRE